MTTFSVFGTGTNFKVASGDNTAGIVPAVGISGSVATTSTITPVTIQAASNGTTIRAANNVLALNTTVCNKSGGDLYLLVGGSGNASTTNFSEVVPDGQTWYSAPGTNYTGILKGYSAGGGAVYMTEYTA